MEGIKEMVGEEGGVIQVILIDLALLPNLQGLKAQENQNPLDLQGEEIVQTLLILSSRNFY